MTKDCKMYERLRFLLGVLVLCAGVLVCASPVSCRLTENGITLVTTDTTAPKVLGFAATSATSLVMTCSEAVTLEQVQVTRVSGTDAAPATTAAAGAADGSGTAPVALSASVSYAADGTVAQVAFSEPTELGAQYCFYCTVRDYSGNTLAYSRYFVGYNDHPARLLLSEVRFGHSGATALQRKAEFVEVYVLGGGNTAGLLLYGGYYGNKVQYAFPAMEVAAGEYITVHTRTYYDDSVDETGENLALCQQSPDANAKARDLWIFGDASFVTKTDVIVLKNSADDSLMDALLVRENDTKVAWPRTLQKELAVRAYECGVWTAGVTPAEAVLGSATISRTLSRQNIAALAASYHGDAAQPIPVAGADWKVVAEATPGSPNKSQ